MFLRFRDPSNTERQCDMATQLHGGSCCANPSSPVCDQPGFPEDIYQIEGVNNKKSGSRSFGMIKTELLGGRPVQIYFEHFPPISAHVVMVSGCYEDKSLEVLDPLETWGHKRRLFDEVRFDYPTGEWKKTYKDLK
jgi:hypothetical protein